MPYINKPTRKRKSTDRKKIAQKLYQTKEWKTLRILKLQECPICERCNRRLSEEVHHKDPFMKYDNPNVRKEKAIYCDLSDLMALCSQCHTEIHKEMNTKKFY